jgi:saccharopine dehydrogenase-like NADP-dependent oxidoreductase
MDALTLLVVIAALGVGISLFRGILSMAHGGKEDQEHAHQYMFKRVAWQAVAVALVLAALIVTRFVQQGAGPLG